MKTNFVLAASLLLGGLAQGQQNFYENKDAPFQASATAMEYQQAVDTPKRVWVARYHKSANIPVDIAVDAHGEIFVTGKVNGPYGKDILTLKFNQDGVKQWEAIGNGSGNDPGLADYPVKIIAALPGNVYVAGSVNYGSSYAYAAVKYDKSSGKALWRSYYAGYGDEVAEGDLACDFVVDLEGSVYITGHSKNFRKDGRSRKREFATVKFDKAGVKQGYAEGYKSDLKMWVDKFENVYLTGNGIDPFNYVMVKYNKAGALEWIKRYQEGIAGVATVSDMFVDGDGNVYVTGSCQSSRLVKNPDYSIVTIKYNSAGTTQWTLRHNEWRYKKELAYALAVDGSENVYVTGLRGPEIVVIKYAQNLATASNTINVAAEINNERLKAAAPEISLPKAFYLAPSYPNPFSASGTFGNPSTKIQFGLPRAARVTLKVYNVLSEEVATLVDGQKSAGVHAVDFTPKKDLPSGIYFAVLAAGEVRLAQRMVYAK